MDDTKAMIETEGLRKSYGSHEVLKGVDFRVGQGEIFAMLGQNGAGKTTTVNILTTLIKPDGGSARISGVDLLRKPHAARELIALTGQYAAVDEFQTGEENLAMMCKLAHLGRAASKARTAELLEQFDLVEAGKKRVSTYSGGMRRRLDLAISLIGRPPVLFLDEPTTGLDPRSRAQMWQVVQRLAADGTTVLLTTQYLEEADRLAHNIAVLDGGEIVAHGTPDGLKSRLSGDHVQLAFADQESFESARRLHLAEAVPDDESMSITVPAGQPVETIRELLAVADRHGLDVGNITIVKPTLDDVFLSLTGKAAKQKNQKKEEVAA